MLEKNNYQVVKVILSILVGLSDRNWYNGDFDN